MNAFDHSVASNEPVAMNTELDSFNQQQSVDTPAKQFELNYDKTMPTVPDNDMETVETASAKGIL